MKIFKCIAKNFKVLIRSRVASFVILLAPLFIFLLLGLAFNSPEKYSLNIGVFSGNYSQVSTTMVEGLRQSSFTVTLSSTKEECISNVRGGISNTCIIFPDNLRVGGTEDVVEIIVDTSKNNMVFVIKDIIENSIELQSLALSQNLTTEMLDQISFIEASSKERTEDAVSGIQRLESAGNHSTGIKEGISNMDFSFNTKELNIDSIEKDVGVARTQAKNSMIKAESALTALSEKFAALEESVSSLAVNGSQKEDLLELMNSTQTQIVGFLNSIRYYSNTTNNTIAKTTLKFQNIDKNLTALSNKLSESAKIKTSSIAGIENTTKQMSIALAKLEDIKAGYNEVLARLGEIKIREAGEIVKPFDFRMISITPTSSQVSLLFPQFLGVVVLFLSLIIPTIMAVNERRSIASTRQSLTPVYRVVYVGSIFITNLIIVLSQVALIMVLSRFLLDVTIFNNPLGFIVGIFLASSTFIIIGIFLGQIFSEEHNAIIAAVSLASLLLFISGVVFPLEAMPPAFYKVNLFNPFVITISLIRRTMFFPMPFLEYGKDFMTLLFYWLGFYFLTFIHIDLIQKRHIFGRLLRRLRR